MQATIPLALAAHQAGRLFEAERLHRTVTPVDFVVETFDEPPLFPWE